MDSGPASLRVVECGFGVGSSLVAIYLPRAKFPSKELAARILLLIGTQTESFISSMPPCISIYVRWSTCVALGRAPNKPPILCYLTAVSLSMVTAFAMLPPQVHSEPCSEESLLSAEPLEPTCPFILGYAFEQESRWTS